MSVQYNQNQIPQQTGDAIAQLPVDQNPPSHNEIQIVEALFKNHRSAVDTIVDESKDALFVGVIVILFSISQIDALIEHIIPITTKSVYILYLIKGIFAAAIFWLVKHFYLSRKGS